ncbi:TonB-dependent receptor [Sphingomonas abietis]|uniref:TonB-dependent receptor n=1 Tax=Sphingomonas abietis TaxID=3012344 RepID=A0ABY7NQE0_9SPHN|nr:TonB-dependent receptor [Sphingomonas abietis]WBO23764.1 TonB-dependent receptor [Sphingomonas abietis]
MKSRYLTGVAALFVTTLASAAVAAPAPSADTHTTATTSDDGNIIVTARRREESLQKVPIAISAFGSKALAATGTFNVFKLTQLQPSLTLYSTNPRNTTLNIRGLGSPFGLTNDGIEQGVGIYVDDVYNSRVASSTFDFVDIDRVEVLRGPQGTLYGKNTTAGAINITTKAPSFTPEGTIELTGGNLDFFQGKASFSGPLVTDKVAIRISGAITTRRGTIFNETSDKYVNSLDNQAIRAQLLWKASDRLDITLSGDYNRQNPNCCAQVYARVGKTQRALNRQYDALAAAFGYKPPSFNAFDRVTDLDTPLRAFQELGGVSLRAKWELGSGTLTSVSAWRFWNWDPSNDRDFIGLPITTISANPSKQNQYTQEIRYAGSTGKIDYVGGLFAFHQDLNTSGVQEQGSAASRWLLNPTSANAKNPAVLDGLRSTNTIGLNNTSLAAFGQATWHVTDRLRVQPGLRLNYDKKSGSYVAVVTTGTGSTTLNSDQRGVLAPQSYQASFSKWNVSGDITLSYDLADDALAYATYSRGFKSGGINLSGLPLDANNQPILASATVKPEDVRNYEVGVKTQWFHHAVTLNLSAFWTDVINYQATVTNGQLGVLRGYLANAGKVRTRGIEADFSARPSDRINLYANGAYTDAKYIHFADAPCPPELSGGTTGAVPSPAGTPGGVSPATCDISGQRLPGVSKWSASFGAEYSLPASIGGEVGRLYAGVDGNYRSTFSSNPSPSAYTNIAGYALVNFRAGFRFGKGWDVFGWVRNAFNQDYYEVLATQSGNTGLVVGQPGEPRTFGGTLRANF